MKTRNIITLTVISLAILVQGCEENFSRIHGEGTIRTETLSLEEFSGIRMRGIDDVHLTYGPSQLVEVKGHHNIITRIRKNVVEGIWQIELENALYGDYELTYYITLPYIDYVYNIGTGNVLIDGTFVQDQIDIIIEGTGNFNGFSLVTERAVVDLTGTGNCEVTANESLDAFLEGTGSLYYKGYPTIDVDVSGTGRIVNANH